MPNFPSDRAAERFAWAAERLIRGARIQRQRLQERDGDHAVSLVTDAFEAIAVVDLSGQGGHDLDYYVYELGRLRDLAREMCKVYQQRDELVEALRAFDAAVPALRRLRNPLTHPSDDARLDDVGFAGAVVRYLPGGSVEYLVDPRYQHHEAAETLAGELLSFLRGQLPDAEGPTN